MKEKLAIEIQETLEACLFPGAIYNAASLTTAVVNTIKLYEWKKRRKRSAQFEKWYNEGGYYHNTVSDGKSRMKEAWLAAMGMTKL